MKTYLVGFLTVCYLLGGNGGAVCMAAGSLSCMNAMEHVRSVAVDGDLAVAKLLADHLDPVALGCSSTQREEALQLKGDVYVLYIIDRLRIIKDDILIRNDGRAALRGVLAVLELSEKLGIELNGFNGLYALALFTAANELLDEATSVGPGEEYDRLRQQAAGMLALALTLDPRIKDLMKKSIRP